MNNQIIVTDVLPRPTAIISAETTWRKSRRYGQHSSTRCGYACALRRRLVNHRYQLSDIDRAFADLETKPVGFVKP